VVICGFIKAEELLFPKDGVARAIGMNIDRLLLLPLFEL